MEASKGHVEAPSQHSIGIISEGDVEGEPILDYDDHPQYQQLMRKLDTIEEQQRAQTEKAEARATAKAQEAVKLAELHFGDTFTELNRRLMTYKQGTSTEPDAALELFSAEKQALFQKVYNQTMQLELTPEGR